MERTNLELEAVQTEDLKGGEVVYDEVISQDDDNRLLHKIDRW